MSEIGHLRQFGDIGATSRIGTAQYATLWENSRSEKAVTVLK